MTTIAYKDGVIAADEAETRNGTFAIQCVKLRQLRFGPMKGCIVGEHGDGPTSMAIIKELSSNKPKMKHIEKPDEKTEVVVMWQDGRVEEYGVDLMPYPMTSPFMAWGSGAEFALGAMAMGATAVEAVKVAAKLDINTKVFGRRVPHFKAGNYTK